MIGNLVAETVPLGFTGAATPYSITGAVNQGFGRFRNARANGESILAMAMTTEDSPNGFKSEEFRGVLGIGGGLTDTITRVKIYQSMTGGVVGTSAINWQADDEIVVYWAANNRAIAHSVHEWVSVAGDKSVGVNDGGRIYKFALSADRICTLPSIALVDEFFGFGVYGKAGGFNIVMTPFAGDNVNNNTASAVFNIPAGVLRLVYADAADLCWRITGA